MENPVCLFNCFAKISFLSGRYNPNSMVHPKRSMTAPGKALDIYYETDPFYSTLVLDENIITVRASAWEDFKEPEKKYAHSMIRTLDITLPNRKRKRLVAKIRETQDINKFISEYKAYKDLGFVLGDINKWIRTELCFLEEGEKVVMKVPVRVFKPTVMILATLRQRGRTYSVMISDMLVDLETKKIAPSLLQITRIVRGRSEKAKKYSEDKGARRALILAFGRTVGFLHGIGHQWRDPYDKNILVSTKEKKGRISEINLGIIDMEGSTHTKSSKMLDVIASRRVGYINATANAINNILYSFSLEETRVGLRSAELFMRGVKEGLVIGSLRVQISDFDRVVRNLENVKLLCLFLAGRHDEDSSLLMEDIKLTLNLNLNQKDIKGIITSLRFVDVILNDKSIRDTYQRVILKNH